MGRAARGHVSVGVVVSTGAAEPAASIFNTPHGVGVSVAALLEALRWRYLWETCGCHHTKAKHRCTIPRCTHPNSPCLPRKAQLQAHHLSCEDHFNGLPVHPRGFGVVFVFSRRPLDGCNYHRATMGQVRFTAISSNRACPTVFIALSSV